MKILPINNILNIDKNHNYKQSFNGKAPDKNPGYTTLDSYIDETGMHYVRNRIPYPWAEQINEVFDEKPQRMAPENIKQQVFLTQNKYDRDNEVSRLGGYKRTIIRDALYDLRIEDVEKELKRLGGETYNDIIHQPFFSLGLADIPLTEKNKETYQTILNRLEIARCGVNVMDENGITLLEKVMNAENEPYFETIRIMCNSAFGNKDRIAYDPMQKYAFDNIRNPEFKEKCKNLPIKFYDIIEDIKNKDLISLDKHIHEQMKCGFCNIQYALRESLYYPAIEFDVSAYPRIVLDIAKKHFPDEVKAFAKKFRL